MASVSPKKAVQTPTEVGASNASTPAAEARAGAKSVEPAEGAPAAEQEQDDESAASDDDDDDGAARFDCEHCDKFYPSELKLKRHLWDKRSVCAKGRAEASELEKRKALGSPPASPRSKHKTKRAATAAKTDEEAESDPKEDLEQEEPSGVNRPGRNAPLQDQRQPDQFGPALPSPAGYPRVPPPTYHRAEDPLIPFDAAHYPHMLAYGARGTPSYRPPAAAPIEEHRRYANELHRQQELALVNMRNLMNQNAARTNANYRRPVPAQPSAAGGPSNRPGLEAMHPPEARVGHFRAANGVPIYADGSGAPRGRAPFVASAPGSRLPSPVGDQDRGDQGNVGQGQQPTRHNDDPHVRVCKRCEEDMKQLRDLRDTSLPLISQQQRMIDERDRDIAHLLFRQDQLLNENQQLRQAQCIPYPEYPHLGRPAPPAQRHGPGPVREPAGQMPRQHQHNLNPWPYPMEQGPPPYSYYNNNVFENRRAHYPAPPFQPHPGYAPAPNMFAPMPPHGPLRQNVRRQGPAPAPADNVNVNVKLERGDAEEK